MFVAAANEQNIAVLQTQVTRINISRYVNPRNRRVSVRVAARAVVACAAGVGAVGVTTRGAGCAAAANWSNTSKPLAVIVRLL